MKSFKQLIYPYIAWISVLIVIPMFLIVLYAFTKGGNDVKTLIFTFDNFIRFFDPVFLKVLVKSLQIAFYTTFFCILLGYPMAYIIANAKANQQNILLLLMTFPMWVNMLVRTYAWISILSNTGIINSFLGLFNIQPLNLLYTDFAVALTMVYNFLPFMILPIYTSLAKLDKSLINASYDLGANRIQTFIKVIFPLSIPGIISGIMMVFLPAVSSFVIPKFIGGGQYVLIGTLIENQFVTVGEWNFGSAISMIMAIIIMIMMYYTKKFDKDIAESGGRRW